MLICTVCIDSKGEINLFKIVINCQSYKTAKTVGLAFFQKDKSKTHHQYNVLLQGKGGQINCKHGRRCCHCLFFRKYSGVAQMDIMASVLCQ